MKPVQYAQVSYVAHFSRLFLFLKFEINEYFHFFLIFKGGADGGALEMILEDFISEIV